MYHVFLDHLSIFIQMIYDLVLENHVNFSGPRLFNGNFRILKWRYASTIFLAIFCGDIHLHRPYIW